MNKHYCVIPIIKVSNDFGKKKKKEEEAATILLAEIQSPNILIVKVKHTQNGKEYLYTFSM